MGSWRKLPAEIRSMVLEIVSEDYRFDAEQYALAGYASVFREWQPAFERRNFQRLVLDQERISGLEQVMGTKQRRDYLGYLFLRVRLNDYDCIVCKSKEDYGTIKNNNDIFSTAICNLLAVLSKWTGFARGGRQQGLTLELGASSPSDSKHTFRNFHLEHNYPFQEEQDLETNWEAYKLRADRLGLDSLNDPYHSWANGHRDDFYRKIAANSLGKLLRETFTCLRRFRHEGWHDIDPQQQSCFEKDYKRLILRHLPLTLKELYIFEDFNKLLHPERSIKRANPSLGRALSKSSRFLENLSAAFLVDAEDFFANQWPTNEPNLNTIPWQNLRTLALTSRLLHPGVGCGKINRLLVAAGRAPAFMLKLEVMEIWNGGEGHACLFQYSNNAGASSVTWASNWGHNVLLDQTVIHSWANLPRYGQYPHSNLITVVHRLRRGRKQVKTYATAIRYLKLRRSVLDPISDSQLCWEEYHHSKV